MRNKFEMDASSINGISDSTMMYMIHHIFLPPKVPQEDDFDPKHERSLLDITCRAIQMFKSAAEHGQQDIIQSASDMMEVFRSTRDDSGYISEIKLKGALQELSKKGTFLYLIAS